MRLLLIEDHTLLREATSDALRRQFAGVFVEEAASEHEARVKLRASWDVIVLDLGLPDGGGFALITHIKTHVPGSRVVVLTAAPEENNALAALEAGADGFVTKRASLCELARAIAAVLDGSRYFSEHVMSCALEILAKKQVTPRLSPRELDVLRL